MCEEVTTFSSHLKQNSNPRVVSAGLDVHGIKSPKRTQGDGMENILTEEAKDNFEKAIKVRLAEALIYHPTNLKQQNSSPPVTPIGQIVNLIPKSITQIKKKRHILQSIKSKEPKFIPYEPYKAAVTPIVPIEKKKKKSKSNSEMDVMASQLTLLTTQDSNNDTVHLNKSVSIKSEVEVLKKQYESEIKKLKEENYQLESQLKFQTQVNGELKNLLVAAVGEDLETKVHLLTEDKLQLARALLNSAQHLNTHQEQIEWLAGQCEVWRSKFLASSLIVEELAKWKAGLCQRTTDLQETIKRLLEERSKIRNTALKTYRILSILKENFCPVETVKYLKLPSTNIIDLSEACNKLADLLKIQLLSGMDKIDLRKDINIVGLEMKTLAEKNAEQLLMSPNLLMKGRQDTACSAVMGAAVALGNRMFLPMGSPTSSLGDAPSMACCPHCSGDVKQV